MGRTLLSYPMVDGVRTRRGVFVPPPPPGIVDQDFEDLTPGNPISAADFRKAIQDPSFGDNPTQRPLMQVVDLGGAEGKVIRTTYPATYYTGGATGVAYSGIELPRRDTEAIVQRFRMRFGAGFETAKGGKAGIGIGGFVTATTPVAPHRPLTEPPSGGNSTPYGWSARCEWGADGKIHELLYLPGRAKYDGSTVYGIGRPLAGSAWVKGQFYDYERRIILNTAHETDPDVDPRTLVQGTINSTTGIPNGDGDYYPDGFHQVLIDGVEVYKKTNEVFRFYKGATHKNLLWSYFRGGGTADWSATTAGSYVDLASHSVEEIL